MRTISLGISKRLCRGQALIPVLLVLGAMLAVMALGFSVSRAVNARLELQAAADAGAQRGASALADGLNLIAIANDGLIALGFAALMGRSEGWVYARQLQAAQNAVMEGTPSAAAALAVEAAIKAGADGALPLNALTGAPLPGLQVKRVYLQEEILGKRIPLWIEDDFHAASQKPFGERFVRVGAWKTLKSDKSLGALLSQAARSRTLSALAEAGVWGSNIWPEYPRDLSPPNPGFRARLIPTTANWQKDGGDKP